MTRNISLSAPSASSNRARIAARLSSLSINRFARPLAETLSRAVSRHAVSPDRLWDPNLLDRLHSPLTRYRD